MPNYEYKCVKCDLVFGRLVSISDKDLQECPVCGKAAVRLPSAPAFAIKGFTEKNGYST